MRYATLIALLALSGCKPDTGSVLAGCRLKYETVKEYESLLAMAVARDDVQLCMRQEGFVFKEWIEGEQTCYDDGAKNLPQADKEECYSVVTSWK